MAFFIIRTVICLAIVTILYYSGKAYLSNRKKNNKKQPNK